MLGKMGKRRKARELAVQVLFNIDFSTDDPEKIFDLVCSNFESSRSVWDFSKKLVLGIHEKRDYIDGLIGNSSKNWRIERMSKVDRCILRLGVYELLYLEDIPPKVSIDEAVELGKRYGTDESGAFINGILDNVFRQLKSDNHSGE